MPEFGVGVRSSECGVPEFGVRSAECRSSECGVRSAECGVRSSEFGVPDHAVVLGGNANRILVTIGIND